MRTKDPKKHKPDFCEVSRRSIKRDFQGASIRKRRETPEWAQVPNEPPKDIKRVMSISDTSGYAKYKRFFVGKLVRILRPATSGGYFVEFVREEDRKYLNANANWSDKREYLLDGAKFD